LEDQAVGAADTATEAFAFSGSTSEYFRIWIVSLCLTIVTLGIYSPWAKVRKRRYLYRSTRLAGAAFDYHADPMVILRGRLIAVAALGLYVFGAALVPGVEVSVVVIVMIAAPWLIVRARMFNARYTSYRNLRFRFDPVYGEAYKVIVGFGFLSGITLGLAYPYARYRRSKLLIDHAHFGSLQFQLSDVYRAFFSTYAKASLLVVAAMAALGFSMAMLPRTPDGDINPASAVVTIVPVAFIVMIYSYLGPAIAKLTVGNVSVGPHRIICDWNISRIMFIYFTNFVAVALTLGLAIPWATIRLQRYQYENLALQVQGDIDAIVATQADEVSAMGEEIGEVFDIDLGL